MNQNGTMPCPTCNGTGKVADPRQIGATMRRLREDKGVSLRALARGLKFSAPYVSDLERGRRGWNQDTLARYKAALKSAFNRIEGMVACAIVAILFAMLLAVVRQVRIENRHAVALPPAPRQAAPLEISDVSELERGTARFKVESHGTFRAGFDNGKREILIVTDLETGKRYLGITGVGISELRSESQTSVTFDSQGNAHTSTTTETKER